MDLLGRKMKKICSIFFHFFPWAQMTLIWIFLVKLRMDIKMANPWLHRNHQYRSKYYVLLSFLAFWKSPFRVRTPCISFNQMSLDASKGPKFRSITYKWVSWVHSQNKNTQSWAHKIYLLASVLQRFNDYFSAILCFLLEFLYSPPDIQTGAEFYTPY